MTPSQYYHRLGKEQEKAKESLARGRAGLSNVRDLDMSGKPRLPRNATAEQLARYRHEMARFDPYAFGPSQSQQQPPGNAQHSYGPAYSKGQAEALGRTVSMDPSDDEAAFLARRFADGHTPPNPLPSGTAGPNPGRGLSPHERGAVFDPSTGNWNPGSAIGGIPSLEVMREMQRQGNAPQAFNGKRFDLDAGETPRRAPEGFHRSVQGDGRGGARVSDKRFDPAESSGTITYKGADGKWVNIGPDGKRSTFDDEQSAMAATKPQQAPAAAPQVAEAALEEKAEEPSSPVTQPAPAQDPVEPRKPFMQPQEEFEPSPLLPEDSGGQDLFRFARGVRDRRQQTFDRIAERRAEAGPDERSVAQQGMGRGPSGRIWNWAFGGSESDRPAFDPNPKGSSLSSSFYGPSAEPTKAPSEVRTLPNRTAEFDPEERRRRRIPMPRGAGSVAF